METTRTASALAAEHLEPQAAGLSSAYLLHEAAAVSLAISAKRMADALERMAEPVIIDGGPVGAPVITDAMRDALLHAAQDIGNEIGIGMAAGVRRNGGLG